MMKQWSAAVTAVMTAAVLAVCISGCHKAGNERIQRDGADRQTAADTDGVMETESSEPFILILQDETETVLAEPEAETIKLLFGGDVLLSDHVLNAYQNAGGIEGVLDPGYRQEIGAADFFMVNQEFPFSSRGTAASDKEYTFRLAPEYVSLFGEMGIDAVTLANNHALDFGAEALLDSCDTLAEAGIACTGAGANLELAKQPVIFEKNQLRVGIIGATRVIPEAGWAAGSSHPGMLTTYDPAVLLKEITQLKEACDYVVVFVHWGIERDEKPQEYQRTLGQQYIDAGADLVVGSHPHVLQGIEYYQGKPVVYSLGNFVFGSSIPRTALLAVTIDEETRTPMLKLLPGTSKAGYTQMLKDPAGRQAFYQYMESISFGVSFDNEGTVLTGS